MRGKEGLRRQHSRLCLNGMAFEARLRQLSTKADIEYP
ncbi:hypothetical protein C4K28_3502 [Pseudomonas chlororaphis subsp. piscium]|nr:hypothetical protein C4K28_3502 [Pseudomonas chlororaphis subsp. piscium]